MTYLLYMLSNGFHFFPDSLKNLLLNFLFPLFVLQPFNWTVELSVLLFVLMLLLKLLLGLDRVLDFMDFVLKFR